MAQDTLSDDDYRALGAFRQAMRQFLAFSAEGATAHGLTSQQHQALLAVRAHGAEAPMTVGELAACLLIRNHSAQGLVARLVDSGRLSRTRSMVDRRRVLLHLTPQGARILEEISLRNLGQLSRAEAILQDLLEAIRSHRPK